MSDQEENEEFPIAKNIPQLILTCMNLGSKLLQSNSDDEIKEMINEHLNIYSDINRIPMEPFKKGLEWFNVSREIDLQEDLSGRIVVLDFFTYCCINCIHILPDLHSLEDKYSPEDGVAVIGVHSAKFDNERMSDNIAAAIEKYNINHPVVNDAHADLWMKLQISCWPTLLILGPDNQPLFILVGEGHREKLFKYIEYSIGYFTVKGTLTNKSQLPISSLSHLPSHNSVLKYPGKVKVTPIGIIITDTGNDRILITDLCGNTKEVIGSGKRGYLDGDFSVAEFRNPQGVAYLAPDTLFVADTDNHAIRKVNLSRRTVETFCGNGKQSMDLEGGNIGINQGISSPWDVCLASSLDHLNDNETKNLLIVAMAGCHQIWGVYLSDGEWIKKTNYQKGTVVRLAGSGSEENRNTTYPMKAGFAQPSGISLYTSKDPNSNASTGQILFIADSESSSIRKFSLTDGAVKGVVGAARDPLDLFSYGDQDGKSIDAKLQHPLDVSVYKDNVYVADSYNHKIKLVKPDGKHYSISTVCGNGKPGNQIGPLDQAQFNEPGGICIDEENSLLYIADTNNHCIKILNLSTSTVEQLNVNFSATNEVDISLDSVDALRNVLEIEVPKSDCNISIKISFDLSSGTTLNSEAPNKWIIENSDKTLCFEHLEGKLNGDTSITFTVESSDDRRQFKINLLMFLCKSSGVCVQEKEVYLIELKTNDLLSSSENCDRSICVRY